MALSYQPVTFKPNSLSEVRMRFSITGYMAGSFTKPFLPMFSGCNSNCGFTNINNTPPGFKNGTTPGNTSVSEINDTSPTITSKPASASGMRSSSGMSSRAFTPSMQITRASSRTRGCTWPWPTSMPTTSAAPFKSKHSVKPPVLCPTSIQRRPETETPLSRSAPSSFKPPRDTYLDSESSSNTISASLGTSSLFLPILRHSTEDFTASSTAVGKAPGGVRH